MTRERRHRIIHLARLEAGCILLSAVDSMKMRYDNIEEDILFFETLKHLGERLYDGKRA